MHQHVQAAAQERACELVELFVDGEVGGMDRDPAVLRAPGRPLERASQAADRGHAGARGGQVEGDRPADAAPGAGDEAGAAGQVGRRSLLGILRACNVHCARQTKTA